MPPLAGPETAGMTPRRRFTLLDGLILLVPIAAGLALSRPYLRDYHANSREYFVVNRGMVALPVELQRAGMACGVASRLVAMGMLAVLALRLRKPRPSLRRVSRQPGAVACAAATGALSAGGLVAVTMQIIRAPGFSDSQDYWPWAEEMIMPAVLASWLALAIGRRWRNEPSWIDRTGRLMGAFWLLLALARIVVSLYLSPSANWLGTT
jgi:hypothetical protein